MRRGAILLVAFAGCAPPDAGPRLDAAMPPYGPLVGGTRITLSGAGFTAPNRVLVGGREAPLVVTVDDATLEVVIPPGDEPGDAELTVLNVDGNTSVTGLFRYSTPPTITGVSPASALYSISTPIRVTGTGFLAEGAGPVTLAVDGVLVDDVTITSDTSLTFIAQPGRPLLAPDLELVDSRGRATFPRAFRYIPSRRDGLLLFPHTGNFAIYFDPRDGTTVPIPWSDNASIRYTAVVRDPHGDYWAVDRSRWFGRIDMNAQRLESPIQGPGWFPTMARIGDFYYAFERSTLRFGRFDLASATFTPLSAQSLPCCGSYGLASDGITTYFTARQDLTVSLNTIDPDTGAVGTPIAIADAPGFHVEDMRFFDGTLYAVTRNGTLVAIDPLSGTTTVVAATLGRISAMEVFEP